MVFLLVPCFQTSRIQLFECWFCITPKVWRLKQKPILFPICFKHCRPEPSHLRLISRSISQAQPQHFDVLFFAFQATWLGTWLQQHTSECKVCKVVMQTLHDPALTPTNAHFPRKTIAHHRKKCKSDLKQSKRSKMQTLGFEFERFEYGLQAIMENILECAWTGCQTYDESVVEDCVPIFCLNKIQKQLVRKRMTIQIHIGSGSNV